MVQVEGAGWAGRKGGGLCCKPLFKGHFKYVKAPLAPALLLAPVTFGLGFWRLMLPFFLRYLGHEHCQWILWVALGSQHGLAASPELFVWLGQLGPGFGGVWWCCESSNHSSCKFIPSPRLSLVRT